MTVATRRSHQFHTTSWSLILAASEQRGVPTPALTDLCERYWAPVCEFVKSRGYPADAAEDLTQSFFAQLLEKNYVAQAERTRGRFRTFLLAAVKHFLANEYDRRIAQKRGGRSEHVSIESIESVVGGPLTPEQIFDKRWALSVLEQVVAQVKDDAREHGESETFGRLLPILSGEAPRGSYADVAAECGTSEVALRVAVHRYRTKFRERLRETVGATVAETNEVDDEIRFLINAVSLPGGGRDDA